MTITTDGLVLEDYAQGEDSNHYWTYLCKEHAKQVKREGLSISTSEGPLCSVEGCTNENVYYYDFTYTAPCIHWRYHKEFGTIYICPKCRRQICGGHEVECPHCKEPVDWNNKVQTKRNVNWR